MSCLSNLSERGQGGDGPTRATERRAHGASSTRTRRATCATSKGKSASRSPPQQQTRGAAASAGGARAGSRRRLPPIATARWDAFCPPSPLEPLSPAPARSEPLSPASRARATARPSPTANACGGAGVSGGGARGEAAERDGGGGGEGRAEPRADEPRPPSLLLPLPVSLLYTHGGMAGGARSHGRTRCSGWAWGVAPEGGYSRDIGRGNSREGGGSRGSVQ